MEEIKIRIWDTEYKTIKDIICFHSDEQIEDRNEMVIIALNRKRGDDFVLMRYTGVKDKHRKEIYEGDIVLIDIGDSFLEIKQQCVVKYDDMNASFCFETNKGNKIYLTRLGNPDFFIKNKVEVIGNIYENPELFSTF